jgi:alpha-acetolactate decarboxylase
MEVMIMDKAIQLTIRLDNGDIIVGTLAKRDRDFIYLDDAVVSTKSDTSTAFSVCIPKSKIVYMSSQEQISFKPNKSKQSGRQLLRE